MAKYFGGGNGSGAASRKVSVDVADTTSGFLASKLVAGTSIALAVLNPGASESLRVDSLTLNLPKNLYVIPGLPVDYGPYFGTVQAAINSIISVNPNASRINLPGGNTVFTENLSLPDGASIELYCSDPYFPAVIVGNITDPVGANTPRAVALTNVQVTGNITLNGTGVFSFLSISFVGGGGDTACSGDISCPSYRLRLCGSRPGQSLSATYTTTYQSYCTVNGNISCSALQAYAASFGGVGKTTTASFIEYNQCFLGSARTHVGTTTLILTASRAGQTFTGNVRADAFSATSLLSNISAISGSLSLLNGSVSTGNVAFNANVPATTLLAAGAPAGKYEANVSLVATALATLAANTTFNIAHTDAAGAVTEPVPLDSGGTIGGSFDLGTKNRASGSLVFNSTGAIVQLSIGGITTAGALAATYNCTIRYLGP